MNEGTRPPELTISPVCLASDVPLCMNFRKRSPISGRTTPRDASFSLRYSSSNTHCVPLPEPEMPKKATVTGFMLFKIVAFFLQYRHDIGYSAFQFSVTIRNYVVVVGTFVL